MKICKKCNNIYPDYLEMCPIDRVDLEHLKDPHVGKLIGGCYRVQTKIASGGMGDVYLAQHEYAGTMVAIKILKPMLRVSEEFQQRTMREARICATIEHRNIVRAHDLVVSDGLMCLVMEFLKGETLRDRIRKEGSFDLATSLQTMTMVAEALAAAHSLDVVHRDIKPSNIFLTEKEGRKDFVKLLDFGIAFALGEARLTQAGAVMGTPPYMAPELLQGGDPTKASDVYSLACVVYRMLAGKTPFSARDIPDVVTGHLTKLPPPITELKPGVPEELSVILLRMLEKDPETRYHDGYELLHALKSCGLYTYEFEDRESVTEIEEIEPDTQPERTGWGTYFDNVAEDEIERTTGSVNFQKGVRAARELAEVEERKRTIVERIEAIEGRRRTYQKNISKAIKTLQEDLSELRDEREKGQMEYLKVSSERDFLKQEVLGTGSELRDSWDDEKVTYDMVSMLMKAGDVAKRFAEVEQRATELGHVRSNFKKSLEDIKFQIQELTRRLREVEDECSKQYEGHREALDELSSRGEELRQEAAAAAAQFQSEQTKH